MNVLISGGSSGLGRALSLILAKKGHRVFAFSRSISRDNKAVEGITLLQADVTDLRTLRAMKNKLESEEINIDWIFNNAGLTEIISPYSKPYMGANWREIIATNVEGPLNLVEVFLPHLLASKHGLIVNMSSVMGYYPSGFFAVYAASKSFLSAWSNALSSVRHPQTLRSIEVVLPMLDTPMSKDIHLKNIKKMPVALAAEKIVEGIVRDEKRILVGDAKLLMRLKRVIPGVIQRNIDDMSESHIASVGH